MHCHAESLASSGGYTSPLVCWKGLHGIHTYQHILIWSYWLWFLEQQCSCWNHMVACFAVMEIICVAAFLCLLCCWLILKFGDSITLTFTLQVSHSTCVAVAYLLYSFDFMDTWPIQHAEFGSTTALSLLISYTNVTYIFEAFIHHLPLHTLMSCHAIVQVPAVQSVHYCKGVGAFCRNPRHVRGVIYLR